MLASAEIWQIPATLVVVLLLTRLLVVMGRGFSNFQGYSLLLSANLGFAVWVLLAQRYGNPHGGPSAELILATLGSLVLVGVPLFLAWRIRRAFGEDRLDAAAKLAGWNEMFVPGFASTAERELYEQMAMARGGRVDEAVAELRRRLVDSEPPEDDAIKERIATLYVFARRYRDAIVQYETHLQREPSHFPGLAIQMVAAYGEMGELERAAELVERLEETLNPQDPTGQAVLLQARLHLLAAAGAEHAVSRLLGLDGLRRMPRALRERLIATARAHAQDAAPAVPMAAGAEAAPSTGNARSEELARFLEGVAERAALDVRSSAAPSRTLPPATLALIVANLIGFALFHLLCGDTGEAEHLVRGGASFHPAVLAGEWWRLWTALFLHANSLHIFFNLYGLFLLGRLVEPQIGSLRFLAIYCVAGLAGNLLSVFNPSPGAAFSMGASGAVLGILGALMVTLIRRRGAYPENVRRGLLLNLGLLLAIEVAFGFSFSVVDNFAHVGGVLAGGIAAFILVPRGLEARGPFGRIVLGALLSSLAASALLSIIAVAREDSGATIAKLPRTRLKQGPISMELPAGSVLVPDPDYPSLYDSAAGIRFVVQLLDRPSPEAVLAHAEEEDAADTRKAQTSSEEGHDERSLRIETVSAPVAEGWSAAGQRAGDQVVAYYARLVDPSRAWQVVLVRAIHGGSEKPRTQDVMTAELRRALSSLQVSGEAILNAPPFAAPPPGPVAPTPAAPTPAAPTQIAPPPTTPAPIAPTPAAPTPAAPIPAAAPMPAAPPPAAATPPAK